jgi:hypothetical protein
LTVAKSVIANPAAAWRFTMTFNFEDHGWSEKHYLSAGDVTSAVSAATKIAQFRLNCLLGSCEMTFAHINDLSPAKDGTEIEPFKGCIWPLTGSYGPGITQALSVGAATAGTFIIGFGNSNTAPLAFNASATTIQGALQGLSTPNALQALCTGTAPSWTITCPPGAVSESGGYSANFGGLTGGAAASIGVATAGNHLADWNPNNIENALMIRCEGEGGQKNGQKWLHAVPDSSVSQNRYMGNIVVVAPPPAALTPITWPVTTFDQVVGDYLSVLMANTVLMSRAIVGVNVQWTSYQITKLKPEFVRDKKVGRPTRSRPGRAPAH